MERFKNSRLARMSSGHYCLIRDLGPVKGGKGLRHHEVILDLSWRGLLRLLMSQLRRTALSGGQPYRDMHSGTARSEFVTPPAVFATGGSPAGEGGNVDGQ
jgi:hypothetical protein